MPRHSWQMFKGTMLLFNKGSKEWELDDWMLSLGAVTKLKYIYFHDLALSEQHRILKDNFFDVLRFVQIAYNSASFNDFLNSPRIKKMSYWNQRKYKFITMAWMSRWRDEELEVYSRNTCTYIQNWCLLSTRPSITISVLMVLN